MHSGSALGALAKAAPLDPVTSTILKSVYGIYELHSQIQAVDQQTADLLFTTHHVSLDISEAKRLSRLKVTFLDNETKVWIEKVIKNTEVALIAVAQLIEPVRIDRSVKQNIGFGNKINWAFKYNAQVAGKHARLSICHQSLSAAISSLHAKDAKIVTPAPGDLPPPYDHNLERFLNWQDQRRRRKSFMGLNTDEVANRSRSSSTLTRVISPRNSTLSTTSSPMSSTRSPVPEDPYPFTAWLESGLQPNSVHANDQFPYNPSRNEQFAMSMGPSHASLPSISAPEELCAGSPATSMTPQPIYNGADGLQVYNPYAPYSAPPTPNQQPLHPITESPPVKPPTTSASITDLAELSILTYDSEAMFIAVGRSEVVTQGNGGLPDRTKSPSGLLSSYQNSLAPVQYPSLPPQLPPAQRSRLYRAFSDGDTPEVHIPRLQSGHSGIAPNLRWKAQGLSFPAMSAVDEDDGVG